MAEEFVAGWTAALHVRSESHLELPAFNGVLKVRLSSVTALMGFPFPHGVTSYLSGGLFLGLGLMVMYLTLGVKAGASSFLSSTLTYVTPLKAERSSRQWRLLFALAMVLGAWLYAATHQAFFVTAVGWWRLALGGVLVGFGTRLSSGCTSGHGICGVASFSRASLLAVAVFMAVAIVTARIVMLLGVTP